MGRGLATKTVELIDAAAAILETIHPATIRGVAYKLFASGALPDMKPTSVKRVERALKTAREREMIPWHWIVDEHRDIEHQPSWSDPTAYADAVKRSYRRDRWQDQDERVILVSEKGTVRGVLGPVIKAYGVEFLVLHGFGSATVLHALADLSRDDDRPLTLLYVGDFDPSGRHMSDEDIPTRITKYGGGLTIHRVALTEVDVIGLPSFDAATKKGDPRYRWYVARFGSRCWELDALDPNVLRDRVEASINRLIDGDRWNRADAVEAVELASLNEVLVTWKTGLPAFSTAIQNTETDR
jgi:hypothetical protein